MSRGRAHRLAVGLLAMAAAVASRGEEAKLSPGGDTTASPGERTPDAPLATDLLKTGLYLIRGAGGNSLLRLSSSGAVLVDAKQAGSYDALRAQIRRISRVSDLPVRVLLLTDDQAHHAGNYARFVAAGVGVVVQENGRRRLPVPAADAASGMKLPAPTVGFDREYRLRMGGVEVHLHHFGNARTDSEAVVHFPDLRVIAVGDLYTPDGPAWEVGTGGSLKGWSAALEQVLALDFEQVVPSAGPVVGRGELAEFKRKVDALSGAGPGR